jgi:hypothetical protein
MARVAIDIADDAEAALAAEQQQQQHQGICRICQLGDGALPEHVSGPLVRLGCGCRGVVRHLRRQVRAPAVWLSLSSQFHLFSASSSSSLQLSFKTHMSIVISVLRI